MVCGGPVGVRLESWALAGRPPLCCRSRLWRLSPLLSGWSPSIRCRDLHPHTSVPERGLRAGISRSAAAVPAREAVQPGFTLQVSPSVSHGGQGCEAAGHRGCGRVRRQGRCPRARGRHSLAPSLSCGPVQCRRPPERSRAAPVALLIPF